MAARATTWMTVALLLAACGGRSGSRSSGQRKEKPKQGPDGLPSGGHGRSKCANRPRPRPRPETLPSVARILPSWARSLKVMTKAKVRERPDTSSEEMGELKMVSRLPLLPYKGAGNGCSKFWLKLEDGAWVCGDDLRPDRREPLLKIQPLMDPGRILPGKYAWVRSGGAKFYRTKKDVAEGKPLGTYRAGTLVRWIKTFSIAGQPYWFISKKVYVEASRLLRHNPSKFQGIDMRKENMRLPVCIVRAKTRGAAIYDKPGGREIMRVPHHSHWEILDKAKVGITKYYRIKPGWILARRVISAWPTKPPPGTKECEKWIEVVIEHQSLVAYEGTEPVYMTMISTGDKKHPTKYGIFRIWWKKAQTDMTSGMGASEFYRVDDVPWAQFFWRGQALHAAYWHNEFGTRKSHGCINLSPIDAKWLYDWTAPTVPPGWLNRRANERHPGTLMRVRHKVTHSPPFHGYSRKLAPPEAVRALDEARRERMRQKSLELLRRRRK